MNLHSKHFDRVRAARSRGKAAQESEAAPPCSWQGCEETGPYRAPLGRGREGEYRNLCLEHVREYNKSYNYFAGMSDDAVAAFQKAAVVGHRPTWSMGTGGGPSRRGQFSGLYDNPFDLFDDGPSPARRRAQEAAERRARRHIHPAERRAFETLGLDETASQPDIKARYKALVKQHHPDANHGDRACEDRLRSVIAAYTVLKRAGLG